MQKIAFRLNSDKAVEYANAHRENNFIMYNSDVVIRDFYFHLPKWYGEAHLSRYLEPGYTDVTENFERDYYWPWKGLKEE